jgi:hypothetical protein
MFVFAADGRIRMCTINAPGSWDENTVADYGCYEKMEKIFDEYGGKIVVNSASSLHDSDFFIRSAQQDPIGEPQALAGSRAATSIQQLSKWGMRMIDSGFPRLKESLPLEELGERKEILTLTVLLHNFQTSTLSTNEILNSYMSRTQGFYSYPWSLTPTAYVFNYPNYLKPI